MAPHAYRILHRCYMIIWSILSHFGRSGKVLDTPNTLVSILNLTTIYCNTSLRHLEHSMERIGSDTRAHHTLASRFVWDQPDVLPCLLHNKMEACTCVCIFRVATREHTCRNSQESTCDAPSHYTYEVDTHTSTQMAPQQVAYMSHHITHM